MRRYGPIVAILAGMFVSATLVGLADELDASQMPPVVLNGFGLWAGFATFGLAASVSFDRPGPALGVTLSWLLLHYFLEILGSLWTDVAWTQQYSLLHHFNPGQILEGAGGFREHREPLLEARSLLGREQPLSVRDQLFRGGGLHLLTPLLQQCPEGRFQIRFAAHRSFSDVQLVDDGAQSIAQPLLAIVNLRLDGPHGHPHRLGDLPIGEIAYPEGETGAHALRELPEGLS